MEGVQELSPMPRIPSALGDAAGLLLAGLGSGATGGVAWAVLRPSVVIDAGGVVDEMASDPNAIFGTVGWLSVIAAVIGAFLATVAWHHPRRFGYLLWVIAVALAATFTAIAVGDTLAVLQHRQDATRISPPLTTPEVWLVAPFVAATVYWLRGVVVAWVTAASGRQSSRRPTH